MALKAVPLRAGVVTDDPPEAAEGYATDSEKIRWVQGKAQSQGGCIKTGDGVLSGPARGILVWATNSGLVQTAIGTTSNEYALRGQWLQKITPIRARGTFSGSPFATTSGSATVTVTYTGHGAVTGDTVYVSGASIVGGLLIGGYAPLTLSSAPFTTISGTPNIVVNHTNHTMTTNAQVTFVGATAVGGQTVSGAYFLHVVDANTYLVFNSTLATSTVTGGGTTVTATYGVPYTVTVSTPNIYTVTTSGATATSTAIGGGTPSFVYEINVGLQNSGAGAGFGVGGFGVGLFGTNPVSNPSMPPQTRTVSLDNWGEYAVFNPLGGTIYQWQNNLSVRAASLSNAPAICNYMLVTAERFMMAFGCTSSGGSFNPLLIRWSDDQDNNIWAPANSNLAGSLQLGEGSKIIAARNTRGGILVWTDKALYLITYTGDPSGVYTYDLIGMNCGLVGPNAVIEQDGQVYWVTTQLQIYAYSGGTPRPVPCPVRQQYFEALLDPVQAYKIYAFFDIAFSAVTWLFPVLQTGGTPAEPTKYMRLDLQAAGDDPRGGWSVGGWARSAWLDNSLLGSPIAADGTTGAIYLQENGLGDNGNAMARGVTYAPIDWGDGSTDANRVFNLRRMVLAAQMNAGTVLGATFYARRWPSGPLINTKGPYNFTSTTPYVDLRVQGRFINWSWASNGTMDFWRLGDQRIDISEGGLR